VACQRLISGTTFRECEDQSLPSKNRIKGRERERDVALPKIDVVTSGSPVANHTSGSEGSPLIT
jgi:hypothetical protein